MGMKSCLQTINHVVEIRYAYGWDVVIFTSTMAEDRQEIFMPPQLVINVQSSYAVHNSSTAAACCNLPVVSLELSKNQTHFISHLDSELCGYASSTTSGLPLREVVLHRKEIISYLYTCLKKLSPISIHVFKEIMSYLYTTVQRNQVLFTYACSKKLGHMHMHLFSYYERYSFWLI